MLIKCPECELQVSDKAIDCPHCGYPINGKTESTKETVKRKHIKLPNGFGRIAEIKNTNLRNRYRAMLTVGRDPLTQKYKAKILGYYPTYNKAYAALVEYHKNPYDLNLDMTVAELYEKWSDQYFETISNSGKRTIMSAWNYCSDIRNMKARDVRARHIKGCMTDGVYTRNGQIQHASPGTQSRIKSMFNLMFDYALEYEIVDKNYARTFNISDDIQKAKEEQKTGHIPFTDNEIKLLWDNLYKVPYIDIVIIQCYSGWRPQELGLLRLENIDLENGYMRGGMKTDAGRDRTVPIHHKIYDLIQERYNQARDMGSEYLFNCTDTITHKSSWKLTYDKYSNRFIKIRDQLHLNPAHRAHDPRVHFVTTAKKYNVDQFAIKYIVGHKIDDITEKVYTKREPEWLKTEIEKIE